MERHQSTGGEIRRGLGENEREFADNVAQILNDRIPPIMTLEMEGRGAEIWKIRFEMCIDVVNGWRFKHLRRTAEGGFMVAAAVSDRPKYSAPSGEAMV